MHRPFVVLGAAFCLGIICAISTSITLPVFYALAVIFLFLSSLSIKRPRQFLVFILVAFFLLGAALLRNSQLLPAGHIARQTRFFPPDISIRGTVTSDPLVSGKKASFVFSAEEIVMPQRRQKTCGKILVKAYRPYRFSYGQNLILSGRIFRPYNFLLSSGLGYRDYLQRKGIYLILSIGKKGRIRDLQRNKGNPVIGFAVWLKRKMEETIERNLEPLPASILNAMLLGERKAVPKFVNDSMVKTGTVHILVVSGFNVGIVAFIFLNLLKALRVSRNPRLWLTIFILIIYCFLTGASTPVVRATIMGLILLCGFLLEREPDIYNSLSLAAILILAFNPWQILDIGFQLSFGSVLAIVWLYPKIKSWFSIRLLKKGYIRVIIQAFAVSLSAWLGTAGLIAYYFRIISPVTVLANMIIVPLTSFITACGFALVIIGKIFPAWGYLFARSCELAIFGLLKVNLILSGAKGAYFQVNPLPLGYIAAYYLALICIGAGPKANRLTKAFKCDKFKRMKKIISPLILLSLLILAGDAYAYWIWTPQTGKWINPKYAVKGSPAEQLKFAKGFFEAREYKKAEREFTKLIHYYQRSAEAAEAQYYIGRIMEETNRSYQSFLAYQRVIDKYPFSERQAEIVERQYKIGEKILDSAKNTFWDAVSGKEYNVVEVFKKVIENAPFGKYAAVSQYKIGLYLKDAGMYPEARAEFDKVINEYPQSEWVRAARYQIALCDAKAAPKPAYDQSTTRDAIQEFKDFVKSYPDAELSSQAQGHIQDLREKEAENNFKIAQFYEKQKAFKAAKVYYNALVTNYQDTPWAVKALEKIRILEKKGK